MHSKCFFQLGRSKSWSIHDDQPMHWESGFIRFKPESKTVAFILAHNFGKFLKLWLSMCNCVLKNDQYVFCTPGELIQCICSAQKFFIRIEMQLTKKCMMLNRANTIKQSTICITIISLLTYFSFWYFICVRIEI